jgi:hypothetical protein
MPAVSCGVALCLLIAWAGVAAAAYGPLAAAPVGGARSDDAAALLLTPRAPRPARARLVRGFDGAGVHHAAFVGEPRAWAAANAPLFKAGVLHLWLRCTCAAADLTAAAGQLQDLELRGLLFVEPRNTQHINSPAAPLLQARARRARLIGKTRAHGTDPGGAGLHEQRWAAGRFVQSRGAAAAQLLQSLPRVLAVKGRTRLPCLPRASPLPFAQTSPRCCLTAAAWPLLSPLLSYLATCLARCNSPFQVRTWGEAHVARSCARVHGLT